jgi:hypothetical protein
MMWLRVGGECEYGQVGGWPLVSLTIDNAAGNGKVGWPRLVESAG